jgi:iron(III) transport system substrate-binding protein
MNKLLKNKATQIRNACWSSLRVLFLASAAWVSAHGVALAQGAGGSGSTAGPKSVSAAEWAKIVEAAKKEDSVTIYSPQGVVVLNELGEKFKKEYGITLKVVRQGDFESWPKIDAEFSTGRGIADVFVSADEGVIKEHHSKGYYVAPKGPAFDNPVYDRATRIPQGTYFENNAFVAALGWNKELFSTGLKDYGDVLKPELAGKIGVANPSTQTFVDFYMFLESNYGSDFLTRLAAQRPRIYPGALPIGQAVTSGEISAFVYGQPLIDEQKKGAPVDWTLPKKVWGARFWGQILKTAPSPNAAQVLANFMVTPAGQEAIARMTASVLPNIPGTLTTTNNVHRQDLTKLTPDAIKAYQEKWRTLFIK